MISELLVHHDGVKLGHLVDDRPQGWAFVYDQKIIEGHEPRQCLSLNFPATDEPLRGGALEAIFRNLLPDGELRVTLARRLGLSSGNDFALLATLAGDCAGALSLSDPADTVWLTEGEVRELSETELRNIVAALRLNPLMAEVEGVRFSLAGEHPKLAVRKIGSNLGLVLGNTLSSHIAKPAKDGLRESVINEAYCTALAGAVGLDTAETEIRHGAVTLLISQRVDRLFDGTNWRARHMEDFCQLMGLAPEQSFEREGGLSLVECLNCAKRYSVAPAVDMREILRWHMFCFLCGIGGANAKQLAVVHAQEGPRLAPFFGLMSSHVYQNLSPRMAMSVGGEDRPDWLIPKRWREFSEKAEIKPRYVHRLLREMAERIPQQAGALAEEFQREHGFASIVRDIRRLIERRARQVIVAQEAEGIA